MKTITLSSLDYVIKSRNDVYDSSGQRVDFVRFLNLTLSYIITEVIGKWKYTLEH